MNSTRHIPLEGFKHICPMCGKTFWAMADWAYKAGYASSPIYMCSWRCLQKHRREKQKGEG